MTFTHKDTNPKDAVGTRKWRQYCVVPVTIIWELGVAMLEGARKYGRHNYRVAGVRASVYVDAAKGHIDQWWEGEDVDADSGLSHITKAMASLAVLRDAMINDKVTDDRPPKANLERVRTELQQAVEEIFERYPDPMQPYTEIEHGHGHGQVCGRDRIDHYGPTIEINLQALFDEFEGDGETSEETSPCPPRGMPQDPWPRPIGADRLMEHE